MQIDRAPLHAGLHLLRFEGCPYRPVRLDGQHARVAQQAQSLGVGERGGKTAQCVLEQLRRPHGQSGVDVSRHSGDVDTRRQLDDPLPGEGTRLGCCSARQRQAHKRKEAAGDDAGSDELPLPV
jgi:hypothetical protein